MGKKRLQGDYNAQRRTSSRCHTGGMTATKPNFCRSDVAQNRTQFSMLCHDQTWGIKFRNEQGSFLLKKRLKDVDCVNNEKYGPHGPGHLRRWCLRAGTRPPMPLKYLAYAGICMLVVKRTQFWPQTFCARLLGGKGPQVRGSTQHTMHRWAGRASRSSASTIAISSQ